MRALLLSLAIGAVGCGSPSPSCQPQGQACDTTHLCCGNDLCTGGQCVAPQTACKMIGDTGCNATSPCCSGLTCSVGTCTQMCGSVGATCSTMNDCCQGSTCPRYGTTCQGGHAGDPCQQNADCLSAFTCSATTGGWCTYVCTSDAACKAPQGVNNCVYNGTNYSCFPFCSTTADCVAYPGTTCKSASDVSGITITVCST